MCGAMEADPFEQPYWNLDQYLIWLASRDPAAVLDATDRPNSGANPPIGWRMHRESNVDRQKVELEAVRAIKGGAYGRGRTARRWIPHIKARVRFNRKWDWVIEFEGEPTFAALLVRTTKHGRREEVRPRFDPQSIARLYPAPTPSNVHDRPDVENPDVGLFIAYHDAMYRLAERISLQEPLPIDEAGTRAEKTIRSICMNTPEKLTMWGFRKADPDAELKPVTPQAWQGLLIRPLYGAATKGEYGPVIWTGLCFDRKQFVVAFAIAANATLTQDDAALSATAQTLLTGGGNGPSTHTPEARPTQQTPLSSSRRGRRARYDWDEAKIVLLDALKQRGDFDETDQEDDWNCQARAEDLIMSHFRDQQPSRSLVRSHVAKIVKEWREDMADNSVD
jgi:hypothetical protein